MIPFEFDFVRAESVDEAVFAWREAEGVGKSAAYFGGGTELVTLARDAKRRFDVAVDYKVVPEARRTGRESDSYVWGSALRLSDITDSAETGLVAYCSRGVADRTARNSITLGGNICGMLAYREAVLPFLLLDGRVEVASTDRRRWVYLHDLFDKRLRLDVGELAVAWAIPVDTLAGLGLLPGVTPRSGEGNGRLGRDRAASYGAVVAAGSGERGAWYYCRRTRDSRLDYPLVTVAMASIDGVVRLAVAGAWGYPARALRAEAVLNGESVVVDALSAAGSDARSDIDAASLRSIVRRAFEAEERPFKQDQRGSRDYRREMTVTAVCDGITELSGGNL